MYIQTCETATNKRTTKRFKRLYIYISFHSSTFPENENLLVLYIPAAEGLSQQIGQSAKAKTAFFGRLKALEDMQSVLFKISSADLKIFREISIFCVVECKETSDQKKKI